MAGGWCSLYITHVAMSSVGMATLGELRWAGRLTGLTWSSARLGTVHGNLRHKKCWAYCSSFTFPQANQFTFYRMNASDRLSWESLSLHLSDRQGWRVIKIQISHLFAWLVTMMEMYKECFYSVFCGELRITHSADTRMANNKILYNVNLFLSSTIDMVADYKETAAPLVTLFLLSAAEPVCLLIRPTVPLSQSMITQNISSIFHIVYLYMCPAALSLCPSAGRSEHRSEAQTEPQEVTGIQCLVQGRVSRRDSGCLERLTFSILDVLFSYMLLPVIISNSEIKNS